MENRVVCFYCGTIYDEDAGKCPLCGGRDCVKEEDAPRPVQRQRITEEERRQRRKTAKGGKFAAAKKSQKETKSDTTKTMLIAAIVFLALSVFAVTWFIGDMIGWWGGLENTIDRDVAASADAANDDCTLLEVSQPKLVLQSVGETTELKLTVNVDCREDITIRFPDAAVVTAEKIGETEKDEQYKTDVWAITAVAEGSTEFAFKCGELSAVCEIIVGEEVTTQPPTETQEPTEPDADFEPELNFTEDVTLYQRGESVPLRVMNLPGGAEVTWRSADETVAKVDSEGIVTAVGGGTTTITAEVLGKTVEILIRCPFDQSGDIGAHLEYTDVTIRVGEVFYLYLRDNDGQRITDVTYEMSEDGICSIEDGKVTGLVGGDYIIVTVTYNTQEFECIIRVRW